MAVRLSEDAVNLAGEKAAAEIIADTYLDPIQALVWASMLKAKEKVAQLEPEWFAAEALSLVTRVSKVLSSSDWIAQARPVTLSVARPNREAPIKVASGALEVHADSAVTIDTNMVFEDYRRRGEGTFYQSVAPHYAHLETVPVRLYAADELKARPKASFEKLRGVLESRFTLEDTIRIVTPSTFVPLIEHIDADMNRYYDTRWGSKTPEEIALVLDVLGVEHAVHRAIKEANSVILPKAEAEQVRAKVAENQRSAQMAERILRSRLGHRT